MSYKVTVQVKEVRGRCAMGYKPGDTFTIEKFYIKEAGKGPASSIAAMLAPPAPLLKGVPATALGNGKRRAQDTRGAPIREKRAEGRWRSS
jgi:uncharacterized repeat protein (TIGR04076 family)